MERECAYEGEEGELVNINSDISESGRRKMQMIDISKVRSGGTVGE